MVKLVTILTVQRVRKYKVQWLTIDIDLDGSWKRLVDGLVLGLTSELRTQIATAQLYTNFISAGSCAILFFKRAYFAYDEKHRDKKNDGLSLIVTVPTWFASIILFSFRIYAWILTRLLIKVSYITLTSSVLIILAP